MHARLLRPCAVILIAAFLSTSCATLPPPGTALTPQEREQAKRQCITNYTAAGAIGGAVIGLLLSRRKAEGALIGAAAGGALAFALAWGHCLSLYSNLNSFPVADARETADKIGYNPSQGFVVRIEDFRLNPAGVAPGGRCKIEGSYYVMAPEGSREVKVIETRTVYYLDPSANAWKKLGSIDQEVTSALGTRNAEGNFDLPPDIPEGEYKIVFTVSSSGISDSAERQLEVKKGLPTEPEKNDENVSQPDDEGQKSAEQEEAEIDQQQEENVYVEVTSQILTLREEPSVKSAILATLNKGEIYELLRTESHGRVSWALLRLDDGTEGWVLSKYVRKSDR